MDKDWFAQGWAEDGGLVPDDRDSEELPSDDGEAEGADPPEDGAREVPEQAPAGGSYAPVDGDRQAELIRFINEYPDVGAGDIPESVWRRAAAGEDLTAAYARYEAEALREENRRLRQSEENRRRSAGSQLGAGAGSRRLDAFDSGWDEAY